RWLIDKSFVTASEKLNLDKTRYRFFKNAVSLIIWLIAIGGILSLTPKLKALAYTLFAGAGILVAVIGFAAQAAFSNIISGIFIVIFKPFRVGDMIKVGTLDYGIVEDITLRHTIINNFENKRIIVPNAVIGSETIVNDSIQDTKVCKFIEVGISYDSDVDLAIKIIQEEAKKHSKCIDVRTPNQKQNGENQVNVRLMNFGDFSVNLRAYVWSDDPEAVYQMQSDINRAIKKRFDSEGIEIPFPYRTIVYKNDLPSNSKPSDNE
ncbi:MAG: mechanosensitive ion channel family protein, partial [Vicingaceae bacterium]|nr:mechanosensitive ion channel family protein [Vicingaceae bacterium]